MEHTGNEGFAHWLLAAPTPSIRYLTLRRLLGRPDTDPDVQAARRDIGHQGPVPAILAEQTKAGNWTGERSYYTPKYRSTHWSMMLLTELEADGTDPRLRRGAEFMLAATQDGLEEDSARGTYELSCFWGNLLRYALHCGYADDPRVEAIGRYLARDAQEGWTCQHNCDLPCAWGAARALWGLAALRRHRDSAEVQQAAESGIAFLVEHHSLVEADYPTPGRVHSIWSRLNFPLFYQADILFVLRALAEWDALNRPGAGPALEWLASRRQRNSRWRGSSPFRRRTWPALGDTEEASRWVSLHAALVLQEHAAAR